MLKFLTLTALILALLVPAISAEAEIYPYAEEDNIINLGEPTWDRAQFDFPEGILIYFYEPYCLPCRQFWPELKTAADSLHTSKSKVRIAKVECHDEVKLCEAKGVSSYPTIFLYRRDKAPYEYRGPRTADALTKWVRKVVDGEYEGVKSQADLFRRYSVALLLAEGDDKIQVAYKDLIDDVEIANAQAELGLDIGDKGAIVTQGGLKEDIPDTPEGITQKVYDILFKDKSAVSTLGARHAAQLQDKDNKNFVLYFRTNQFDYQSQSAKDFDSVAKELGSDQLQFAYVNVAGDILGSTMARLFDVESEDKVTIGIAEKDGKVIKKYKLEDFLDVTAENIRNLISDFNKTVDGKRQAPRFYMSAGEGTPREKGKIWELTGSNFKTVTEDPTLNVFVMFYFPWCEWCVKLEPTWKALAYRYREVPELVLARIDMSQNDAKGYDLSEYPVLVYFDGKAGAQGVEYLSERTMKKFKDYLEERVPRMKEIDL